MGGILRTKCHWLLLAAIVIVGGWLRLSRLELMEFKQDEWQLHELAVCEARGKFHPAGLMSSVGLRNPPMAVHLFALPAVLNEDPLFLAAFPATLNTAAILLTYFLARRWMSRWCALVPCLLFAVSPWAVLHSRKIWAQDLLPLFSVLFLFAAVRWLDGGRKLYMLLMAGTLAVLNQIHYSSLALLPVVGFLAWRRRSRGDLGSWTIGLLLYLALWAPFIVHLCRKGRQELPQQTVKVQKVSGFFGQVARAFKWHVRLMGYGGFSDMGPLPGRFQGKERRWDASDVVLALLLIGGVLTCVLRARRNLELWLLLLWFALPPILLSAHRIYSHYLIVCLPVSFVLVGLGVEKITEFVRARVPGTPLRMILLGLALAALAALALHEVLFFRRFLADVAENGGTTRRYGIAYRDKLSVARFLRERCPASDFFFLDFTHPQPDEETYSYLYRMLGGAGRMRLIAKRAVPADAPVFVALGPAAEGRMRPTTASLKDCGIVQLGALRVQCLEPAR